jgi:hypothetical protein
MEHYLHTGLVSVNGEVDTSKVITEHSKLKVVSADDSFHLREPVTGNFEWWYFDIIDEKNGCVIKVVAHIGTDPLKTKVFPQLALSVSTPGKSEYITKSYLFPEFEGSTEYCHIRLKDDLEITSECDNRIEYRIKVSIPEFSAGFNFVSELEGWKPVGDSVLFNKGSKSGKFSWIIPVPKARVSGEFLYGGKHYTMQNAIGYHDYNYWSVNKNNPLFLDNIVSRWYWGKCYIDDYTIIFMDTHFRINQLSSIMIARDNKIIHSSNNLIDLIAGQMETDEKLKVAYPSRIIITLNDNSLNIKLELELKKISDSKDLLEGVSLPVTWLIKKFVARPAYFGIYANAILETDDKKLEGTGNYEMMVFRNSD